MSTVNALISQSVKYLVNTSGITSNVISPLVHMKVLSNDFMSFTLVLLHSGVFFSVLRFYI